MPCLLYPFSIHAFIIVLKTRCLTVQIKSDFMRLTGEECHRIKMIFLFLLPKDWFGIFKFLEFKNAFLRHYNQEKLILSKEIWCDDTKFTSLRYVTNNYNYDHINCSGVSLSSGQIVLDQLHRNECMLQFSDSLRMVVIFVRNIF